VSSIDKNLDSWAAKCFQGSFKEYFEVETSYVLKKLLFILFPFFQFKKDEQPVQYQQDDFHDNTETSDIKNMTVLDTDLYIPMMAFTSYILLSCLYLGMHLQ
jgi:hypothetical protein